MSPDQCALELARLLGEQAAVCRQILEKTRQQQTLVEEQKEDELLSLLGDKQKLIDKQQKVGEQALPFRAQWVEGARERAGADAHARVETAYNDLRTVMDEIIRLEDASRNYLEEQKEKVSRDITLLQRGKMANKAYGGGAYKPPPGARYSDKKG